VNQVSHPYKSEVVPLHAPLAMKAHGGVEVYFHAFLNLTLDVTPLPLHHRRKATPSPHIFLVETWVGLTAGLYTLEERKITCTDENRTAISRSDTPWLSHLT